MIIYIVAAGAVGSIVFSILFLLALIKGSSLKIPFIGMAAFVILMAVGVALTMLGDREEKPDTAGKVSQAVESQGTEDTPAPESQGTEDTPAPESEGQEEAESIVPVPESAPQPPQKAEQTITAPVTYTGNGDDVVTLAPFDGVFVFHITGNQAGRHFAVKGYDSNGNSTQLFVNTTSVYDGITIDQKQETKTLEVNASGSWTVEVQSINAMKNISSGGSISGSGDSVVLVSSCGNTATISGNSGRSHFAVKSYGKKRDTLLVNTTDVYEGTVLLAGEPIILEVNAVGEWSIAFD